ncbi:HpcH/HpaI aldolase/citrate lyase family protein [Methylocapsa acidiphila]|uniref:HpcH/HpaI aldolase/citrate lyase family protein n=1 Tax=Methylocapsa acidiphila TaxID=133552 RepID=UPI00042089C9|nr:CoA ester lyase [Methylocapsa acidiphila]
MRSLLFVPADSERKLAKALSSGADCLAIDLEDSVTLANKAAARRLAFDFLQTAKRAAPRALLYVRVNALDSGLVDADLDAIMPGGPDGVLLPKCVDAAALQHLGARLAVKEAECDLTDGATRVIAIVTETAGSLFNMGGYAGASRRLVGLAWGAEDLSACLGSETSRGDDGAYTAPYALARTLTLLAANAADALAIDAIYPDFHDLQGLRKECDMARRDGFAAKMAIHPAQVAVINEALTPSPQAIARARAIVAAFAAEPDMGVVSLDGAMLDRPHLVKALRLLARTTGKDP